MQFDPFDIVRISLLPGIGPARGRALLHAFGAYDGVRRASATELMRTGGIDRVLAARIRKAFRDEREEGTIERAIGRMEKKCASGEIRLCTYRDDDYPRNLEHIYDPPLYLFIRGALRAGDGDGIAVIGTRNATAYGREAARAFTAELVRAGATIISGLALGIDTVAHQTAVQERGRTVAVLGSGVDLIYPSQNRRLAERIAAEGCLVSELPLGAQPDAVNFPRRNRIISGLSQGVLVIESAERGGAMITAQLALDQGKSVFAIPGGVFDSHSRGTNLLIKSGMAKLVQEVQDVLEEIPSLSPRRAPRPDVQVSLLEEELMSHLTNEPVHIDQIADESGRATSDLLVQLLQLEFKGLIRQLPGKMFVRSWN